MEQITQLREQVDLEYRQKFQERADKIDEAYQREKVRQESVGESLSRITPISSLIYATMNLSQTGKLKRDTYFQTATRYYIQLEEEYLSSILDDDYALLMPGKGKKITPPPDIAKIRLSEILHHSMIDLLMLGFFTILFTTMAFLKFFRTDI